MPSRPASFVVDFHVHAHPGLVDRVVKAEKALGGVIPDGWVEKFSSLRRLGAGFAKKKLDQYTRWMHRGQTVIRHLPPIMQKPLDALSMVAGIPSFVFESTVEDLQSTMESLGVHHAVLIAHPPTTPNEFVLQKAREDHRLIAAVNIPRGVRKPGDLLRECFDQGAQVLKIHAAADGEGPDSARYRALLATAQEIRIPVILHTGCIHLPFYRDPRMGHPRHFEKWFKIYPKVPFILAHMNYHEPLEAIDLAETHANVFVDTSWQPAEMIGEAVRRAGAEKVLFGSDWPLMGNNMAIGIERIWDCVDSGLITETDAHAVLGANAARLLNLSIVQS